MDLKVAEYRKLWKNDKGYHYSYDVAKEASPNSRPKEVYVLLIDDEYYPLPEPIRLWDKWQDENYD